MSLLSMMHGCSPQCWNYSTPFQAPNGWAQPPNLPKIKRYNGTTYRFSWQMMEGSCTWGILGPCLLQNECCWVSRSPRGACSSLFESTCKQALCHAYCHLDKPHTSIITSSYTINYNAHLCAKPCLKDRIQSLLVFCHVRSQLQKCFLSSTGAQSPVLPQPT